MQEDPVMKIGIVLETREDALKMGISSINELYHWREDIEIDKILQTLFNLDHVPVILGPPDKLCRAGSSIVEGIDIILNLSVGFSKRFRLSSPPSIYEYMRIPYTGADPYSKMVSQNKHLMKSFFDKLSIPTPDWTYIQETADLKSACFPHCPVIIKPAHEGSSVGIGKDSVILQGSMLNEAVEKALLHFKMPFIVERFIPGRELKVGMIGDCSPRTVCIAEDVYKGKPLGDKYLFFEAKKAGVFDKIHIDHTDPLYAGILDDCNRIYDLFKPLDFCTFDIRQNENKEHFFLEFNADATLHPHRTLAQCCELSGIPYKEMFKRILDSARQRWGLN